MYPMTEEEFDKWLAIFREHFPNDPLLYELGTTWYAGKSPL
jgi:hypothetical protein